MDDTFKKLNIVEYRDEEDHLHRLDGPALITAGGDKYWFQDGERHRTDGPAVEFEDGRVFYHLHNLPYSEEEFHSLTDPVDVEATTALLGTKFKIKSFNFNREITDNDQN